MDWSFIAEYTPLFAESALLTIIIGGIGTLLSMLVVSYLLILLPVSGIFSLLESYTHIIESETASLGCLVCSYLTCQ